nr:MFS transporter [Spongiactinospora gelatinilytica]
MFDVVIVGGGPAGMAGALALGRVHRAVLLVDAEEGRNAAAGSVHNFLSEGLIMASADLAQNAAAAHPKGGANVPLATAGLLIGMLLSVLDQTVVAIALPDIAADLGGMDAIGWIVTSYILASTATGALYGRISDRFGRRPVFVTAVAVFVVGSALCGLAQTTPQMIAARTFQGIGAGALFVLPAIALSELFPQRLRSRVQGFTGGVFAVAGVGGPLAGGAITDAWGWRWIFYVNLPLGLLAMALAAYALRLPKPGGLDQARTRGPPAAMTLQALSRSRATSTIMSSWPPTRRRLPPSSRTARTSTPYLREAVSAWRRKLAYAQA